MTMRGFDEDDFREVGRIMCEALADDAGPRPRSPRAAPRSASAAPSIPGLPAFPAFGSEERLVDTRTDLARHRRPASSRR